ncbi:hypothetical protein [Rhodococcus kronopolitis]|uniref:Uncharacterized protein n=1 Tax=Rhodococcus kronopolitis TaxID=1460226 RepID=A0ABV9FY99_9NOCA
MSLTPADRPHRQSRIRRAIAASGVVGAIGLGALTTATVAAAAPLLGPASSLLPGSSSAVPSGPAVSAGTGRHDVVSGGS